MKKALSLALAMLIALSVFPVGAFADAAIYGSVGDSLVSTVSDASTSAVPSAFGTEAANGMVWTDKSVSANSDNSSFDVTLSALAQEYAYSKETLSEMQNNEAADVLLILDFSSSMTNESKIDGITRFEALIKAVNLAMRRIMTANKKNRVMICWYAKNVAHNNCVVLNLGSYATGTGADETDQDYFQYVVTNGDSKKYSFQGVPSLHEIGGAGVSVSTNRSSGTYSQKGIAAACENFISQANTKGLDGVRRTPFILFMTDGNATNAGENFADFSDSLNTGLAGDGSTHEDYQKGDQQVAAATLLTAAYQKNQVISTYNALNTAAKYNGISNLEWYNVGIAVIDSTSSAFPMALHVMLNPTLLDKTNPYENDPDDPDESSNTEKNARKSVYYWLKQYSKDTAYDITKNDNYLYTTNGYVTYANTSAVINSAFTDLGEAVARLTSSTVVPITSFDSNADNVFITFTDTLGDGTVLKKGSDGNYEISLELNGANYKGTPDAGDASIYHFSSFNTYAKLTDNRVIWYVHEDELPIIRFASRYDPGTAYDYDKDGTKEVYEEPLKSPIRVVYTVVPTVAGVEALTKDDPYLYSNAWSKTDTVGTTTAVFKPSAENPYYYTGTTANVEAAKAKATNTTVTAAGASNSSWDSGNYVVNLGNNGRLQRVAKISIEGNQATQIEGQPVDYKITVENLSDTKIEGAVISADFNGVTVNSADTDPDEGKETQWTKDIPANDKVEITVKTTVNSDAADAADPNYTQKASFAAGGGKGEDDTPLNVNQGYIAVVNTTLDNNSKDINVILDDGTKLFLKDGSGNLYPLKKTADGKYVSSVTLPAGTYFIYSGETPEAATKLSDTTVTLSEGGDNSATLKWVTATVGTYLDDVLTDVTDITEDKYLTLGDEKLSLDKTGTGAYKVGESIPSPENPTDFAIKNDSDVKYDDVEVTADGPNHQDLYWYTVKFVTEHGTKPEDQIVIKSDTATDPGALTDEDYTFEGWYTSPDYDTPFDFTSEITKPTTVYAKWHLTKIPVKYNGYNEGSMPATDFSDTETPEYNSIVKIDPNVDGTYNGSYSVARFNPTHEPGYKIYDPIANPGKIFAGWTVSYPEPGVTLYTAQYYDDVKGDPDDPDNKGDGIPDMFQKRIVQQIVNGTWDGTEKEDIISYVTLRNDAGEYDVKGKATVTFPLGMKENSGFVSSSGSWSSNKPSDNIVTGLHTETFVYTYDTCLLYYNSESSSETPTPVDSSMGYLNTLTVNPNGGTYRRSKDKTVYDPVSEAMDITDPVAPSGKAFIGWHKTVDGNGNVTLTAVYKNVTTAPKTGDSLHRAMYIGLTVYFAEMLAFFIIADCRRRRKDRV